MTTPRSARTREAIVGAALELFRENGYERTTMRAVAARARVSVGNAYYYFSSKEELVQGFYDQLGEAHRAAARPQLRDGAGLGERLERTLQAWIDVAEPYHDFAGRFFAVAAQPDNPLSPFSAASHPARTAALEFYREVLAGSSTKVDPSLAAALPELLWLYHLGIVAFWVHDRSERADRTRLLAARTAPMVEQLARLSRLPIARPLARQAVELLGLLRH